MATKSPTAAEFRLACGQFATGVSVVTAERAPGKVHGMTANSVTSVSLNPLLLLVCVDHRAQLLPMVQAKGHFGVSVLKQEQQAISRYFAQTVEDVAMEAKLGIQYRWTESGVPLLDDALVHIACRVIVSARSWRSHDFYWASGDDGNFRRRAAGLFSRRLQKNRAVTRNSLAFAGTATQKKPRLR